MKQFLVFIRKEFYHVLRDKKVLLILFGMPVVQVLLFGFALSSEVKDTNIVVVDYAKNQASRQLINKIEASRYFEIKKYLPAEKELEASFKDGKVKAAILIPANFHKNPAKDKAHIQIITDATDVNLARAISNFIFAIVTGYDYDLNKNRNSLSQIVPEIRMLYNPQLKGAPNFVPGVMALVLLLVCVLMTAVAIVKEKETGTMEILLVSPMRPALVLISKAIPYLLLSLINLTVILLLSVFVLDLPVKGSLILLLGESALFIITCLTLGILISIVARSQQVAMLISLVGMMMPTMMLSGFMFPTENMPIALQLISNIVPSKWYYIIVKEVMVKGAGFSAVWRETLILAFTTVLLFLISLKKFKVRME